MTSGTRAKLAGYGALAATGMMAEPADAGIITSNDVGFVPVTIAAGQAVNVDFGGGVGTVFRFVGSTYFYAPPSAEFVLQTGGAGGSQNVLAPFDDPTRLPVGYLVSAGKPFVSVEPLGLGNTGNDIAGASAGYFNGAPGQTVAGFIGVRFSSPGLSAGLHYGFFQLSYDNDPTSANGKLTILGFAYETDPDAPITTFNLVGPAAVPEPASLSVAGLGLLACGAAGLRRLRAARAEAEPTPAV